jgi:hypothetical protein
MPSLDDLCEVAHDKYTKAQLKEMELECLRVLQWELHAVTPHAALEQLAIIMNHTEEESKPFLEHAEFFIDMSYYEVRCSPPPLPRPLPIPEARAPPPRLAAHLCIRRRAVPIAQVPPARRGLLRPPLRLVSPRQREGGRVPHAAAVHPVRSRQGEPPRTAPATLSGCPPLDSRRSPACGCCERER